MNLCDMDCSGLSAILLFLCLVCSPFIRVPHNSHSFPRCLSLPDLLLCVGIRRESYPRPLHKPLIPWLGHSLLVSLQALLAVKRLLKQLPDEATRQAGNWGPSVWGLMLAFLQGVERLDGAAVRRAEKRRPRSVFSWRALQRHHKHEECSDVHESRTGVLNAVASCGVMSCITAVLDCLPQS